ncbi:hypothetical protein [Methylobacter sp.]|uniref:hypothetical protein n=1 Tax=Methylobacter sp. TaxID=2051955 RepID=UPI002486F502|nr:hypothetical protein [Methylobacter sp.]MDI1278052.1 hypothetical protein [Methylobacter sp.]
MNKPNAEMMELLIALRRQLEAAAHGQGGKLIADFSELHGRSKQTIWRWLGAFAGYQTQRKKRTDAGTSKLPEESLVFIAASKSLSVRANGKATKPTGVAMNIADANGLAVNIGASQINRILRSRKLDAKSQANARNHTQLRSLYPNHVHQIDPSLCLIYYVGKRQMMMTEAEFNKNKPAAIEKVKLKVWRYVRYDHASGSLDVRYYEAAGENQRSLFEFLLWTWGEQPKRLSYGIPKLLLWDKGSANTSAAIKRLLDAMGVDHQTHATHHAWVKGGVENGNRIVEMHFESRLRDQPVDCVEELNASSELWVRDYNANAIKHVDSRVQRDSGEKLIRDELWQMILRTPNALVKIPERKVCSWFLTGKDTTRQVRNGLITYVHPELEGSRTYNLSQWAEFYSQKDTVKVSPVLLAEGEIRVEIEQLGKEPLVVQIGPEKDFDEFGRMMSGTVIGDEYKSAKHTVAQQAAKDIAKAAYGDVNLDEAEALLRKNVRPFMQFNEGKGIVAHSHLGQGELPQRLLPTAKELESPELAAAMGTQLEFTRKNLPQMAKLLQGEFPDQWNSAMLDDLKKRFPDGATAQELEQVRADLRAGRSVGGKARLQAV